VSLSLFSLTVVIVVVFVVVVTVDILVEITPPPLQECIIVVEIPPHPARNASDHRLVIV